MLNSLIPPDAGVHLRAQLLRNSVNSDESWGPWLEGPSDVSTAHFSPDGCRLVWGSDNGRVHILDVACSLPIIYLGQAQNMHHFILTNGLYVAYMDTDRGS